MDKVQDFKPAIYGEKNYIQLRRSKETEELMENPACFMLLSQIALRARRTNSFNIYGLKIGEALIGDYKEIGLTEQKYRTAKRKLTEWQFISVKSTNKGTIARIINTSVYDINEEKTNDQATIKQRSSNDQLTTNNNDKKEKKDKKDKQREKPWGDFEKFWEAYPKRHGKKNKRPDAEKWWLRNKPDEFLIAKIMLGVKNLALSSKLPEDAITFLRNKRWEDWQTPEEKNNKPREIKTDDIYKRYVPK